MREFIKSIMDDYYWSSFLVFVSQIIFVYLRTLNVIYTTDNKIWLSIITGAGTSILTLISFSIGINSIMNGEFIPISLFIAGGAVGTYLGIKQNEINENK